MSNNPEDFEKLRRVMKLKRFEQPPPGYFHNFSSKVINQIEAQRHSRGAFHEVPWLQRLLASLESSPAFAGAFGILVCGALIAGVAYSTYTPAAENNPNLARTSSLNIADSGHQGILDAGAAYTSGSTPLSTAPIFNTNLSAGFSGNGDKLNFQPVNFSSGN